jgi:uncharacterized membrane protein YoaK (UPF0700 family)
MDSTLLKNVNEISYNLVIIVGAISAIVSAFAGYRFGKNKEKKETVEEST